MPTSLHPLLLTAAVAFPVHLIFKRYEPRHPFLVLLLLIGVPFLLSALLFHVFSPFSIPFFSVTSVYLSTLCTSIVLYRISPFHPLAKFPGPFINKISALWMVNVAIGGKRHRYIKEIHEKYGPYVRIAPNCISISDSSAILPVLGSLPKGPLNEANTMDGFVSLVGTRDSSLHAELRKPWGRAFTLTALKEYDGSIFKRTKQLIQILEKQNGVIDLGKWLAYFSYDLIGDLVFDGAYEMLKEGSDSRGVSAIMVNGKRLYGILAHIPWIYSFLRLFALPHIVPGQIEVTQQRIDVRKRTASTIKDLFYHFAEGDKSGCQRSPDRVFADVALAVVAGSDTVSTAAANTMYLLLSHPLTLRQLRDELDEAFKDQEINDQTKLATLLYLNACINESLRLLPPLTSLLERGPAKGSGGAVICGRFIPEGTGILLPPYAIHRNPLNFSPCPDSFQPERWLDANCNDFVNNTEAFIPFSFGPANCAGKKLAIREIRMVVATLLHKYDICFAEGWNKDRYYEDMRDDTVLVKGEFPVVLEPRVTVR